MKTQEARDLGDRLESFIRCGEYSLADDLILPSLNAKTSFAMLDVIGLRLGKGPMEPVNVYLDSLASRMTMGGWVVIASALRSQMAVDLSGAFQRCETFTRLSSTWYGVDIFGERVPGPALVMDYDRAVELIEPWRSDPDRWIRRMVGVAVHYWAKQAHGNDQYCEKVKLLLTLLEPMFTERNIDAVKGVGWGLKTLGRYYPSILADWLTIQNSRPHIALMMRKALKFLPENLKVRAMGKTV
jgi:3-methyladenine DNA glycosylase AlkD